MKTVSQTIIIPFLILVLLGCTNDEPIIEEKTTSETKVLSPVELTAEMTLNSDNRILVQGKTNLPEGAKLLLSLQNSTINFLAQDKSVVNNQSFQAGPFGPESGLLSGEYILDVVLPVAAVQPDSVKRVIGNQGQNLVGSLVIDSEFTGKIVEANFSYTVSVLPGEAAVSKGTFGENWPLTVQSGTITCEQIQGVRYGQLVTFTTGHDTYALNGTAKGHAKKRGWIKEVEPIWRDNPKIAGTKINIGTLIDSGLELCE